MNRIAAPLLMLVILVGLIAGGTFYQVDETEMVVVTQFGEPIREPVTTPGLHFKVPFIQTIRRFDKRVLEWDGLPGQIPTLDKRFIVLDTSARWRIADPLRFLQSVGDERSAQSRLDDLINSAARDVVSSHLLIQAVRSFARELPTEDLGEGSVADEQRSAAVAAGGVKADVAATNVLPTAQDVAPEERLGRDRLTELMVKRARENLPNLGIELIDVRIKAINYVREVEQRVYERMISERRRIAARFRSEGDGASAKIRGEKERELDRLRSEAYRKAQEIIGKADAEAARIYAEAYGQDTEFYAFFQTMEAYKQTLQKNASLLLSTESDFYQYLKELYGPIPAALRKEGQP
ncbi:MAG: protease modulator HflC [Candidatus Tectimicrobiota bacterium]